MSGRSGSLRMWVPSDSKGHRTACSRSGKLKTRAFVPECTMMGPQRSSRQVSICTFVPNWRWTSPFGSPFRWTGQRSQEQPGWAREHGRIRNESIWKSSVESLAAVRPRDAPTRSVPLSRIGMEAFVGLDECRVLRPCIWHGLDLAIHLRLISSLEGWMVVLQTWQICLRRRNNNFEF